MEPRRRGRQGRGPGREEMGDRAARPLAGRSRFVFSEGNVKDMSTGVRVTGVVLAALVLGLATSAFAAAGDGVRLGGSEGRLHPYL
ncbi:MAG TPA: hypothetical protein VMM92_01385, partial [Thermoanaerobaculia bacterium]|nr:hypothetical protein [Thermoanaerobaculia bacterium]